MSLFRMSALIVPLLVLLPWLAMRGINAENSIVSDALQALKSYAVAENLLHRDALAARAGILRNYDPLVQEIKTMRQSVERLQVISTTQPTVTLTKELADIVDAKEELSEQFKSQNSLLQNSLAYFGMFSTRLSSLDKNTKLAAQISNLAAAMLHLTLDTSPAVIEDVDQRLRGISTASLSPDEASSVNALVAHGHILSKMLPETNDALRRLLSLTTENQQEALRVQISNQQKIAEKKDRALQYVLYVISLLLAGLLVLFGSKLDTRAINLRWRAHFEHLIATISTRFIGTHPAGLTATMEQALAELASYLNADRAYFLSANQPDRVFKWSRTGVQFPENWPERALNHSRHLLPNQEGIIHIPRVSQDCLSRHGLENVLATDVEAWLCILSLGSDAALLGFDGLALNTSLTSSKQFELSRVAFDAMTYAIEREVNEHEKKRLENELHRSRRMETVGAFASGIAHNFNNIMGAILGYTEMALAHARTGSNASRNLVEIQRAGERARDLVDQILKFGQRVLPKREKVSVDAIVLETKSLFEASLAPGIDFIYKQDAVAMTVEADSTQLQQVLLNVCNNAAQAIDGVGKIELVIDASDLRSSLQIGDVELKPGLYVIISVLDDGRGMDTATSERIFEPFFTTRVDGNGLGLATVYEIVRDHGGAVNVQSRPGLGTRFDIWIPSVQNGDPAQPQVHRTVFGKGETLLLLEIDQDKLCKHEEILAALGYEPVGFTTADAAVSAIHASPTRFDLILICLPKDASIGLEIARELHQARPDLHVILNTVSTVHFSAASLAAAGVTRLVTSQFSSPDLMDALRQSLTSHGAGTPPTPAAVS